MAMCILGIDVTEIYSPERVNQVCERYGLTKGSSMDLTNGWDFDTSEHRRKARRHVIDEEPFLVVGSPPCTYLSMLQELNKSIHKHDAEWMRRFELNREKAIRHIRFCCELYQLQMDAGRYFLHGHPWSARSWQVKEVAKLMADPRVKKVRTNTCRFEMTTDVLKKGWPTGLVKSEQAS